MGISNLLPTNMNIIVALLMLCFGGVMPLWDNHTSPQCTLAQYQEPCAKKKLKFSDADVDLSFQIPDNYNLEDIVHAVTDPNGPGWIKLEGVYSQKDIEMAKERAIYHTNTDFFMDKIEKHEANDEVHNNYRGLVWALLNKGQIFEKMIQHPIIYNGSTRILGQGAQISSFATNTVLPGMKGQQPHLDYPYYRNFLPQEDPHILDNAPPLAVQFVTLLTDFTEENGATAIRPRSHINPRYPDSPQEFFDNAIQMTGKAGDMVIFHGALQHCAMGNKSKMYRSGILQHMVPVYLKTFEDVTGYVSEKVKSRATAEMRQILSLDHPYPILKV